MIVQASRSDHEVSGPKLMIMDHLLLATNVVRRVTSVMVSDPSAILDILYGLHPYLQIALLVAQ
jgi:hypothetical protein